MFGKSSNWIKFMIAIIMSTLISFGNALPASAIPDVVTELPITVKTQYSKTLNNGSIFTWGSGYTDVLTESTVNGVLLGEDGTVLRTQVFDVFEGSEYLSLTLSSFSQLRNGTLLLAWARYSSISRTSKLYFSTSFDGINWTTKSKPIADFIPAAGNCLTQNDNSPNCGYQEISVAQDSTGRVALAFSTRQATGSTLVMPVTLLTSTNLSTWTVAVTHRPSMPTGAETYVGALIGLNKGGFGLSWTSFNWDAEESAVSTGIWLPKAKKISTVRTTKDQYYRSTIGNMVRVSANKYYSFSYVLTNQAIKLGYEVLDITSRTWSKVTYFNTAFPGMLSDLVATKPDLFGDVRIVVTMIGYIPGLSYDGDARTYQLRIPSGKSPEQPVLLATTPEMRNAYVVSLDSDNNVVLFQNNPENDVTASVIANNQLGNPQVVSNGSGGWRHITTDNKGNAVLFQQSHEDSITRATFIRPDIKPLAKALPIITGSAKKNGTVTVSDIQFVSNTTVGTNTYQWFLCETAVSRAQFTQVPANCMAIPGANSRSYRVTVSEKGKYLAATVSNTNATGTTQILSKSTSKVK
jgi:hypothetical protein